MKINPAGLKKFNEEQARLQSLVDADPIKAIKEERALSSETPVGGVLFTSLKASILIDAGSRDKDKQAIQDSRIRPCPVPQSVFRSCPKPSTRSPGFSSSPVADGSASGGLLARSESAVAPRCDRGGCGDLRSLRVSFLVLRVISILSHEAGAVLFAVTFRVLNRYSKIQHRLGKNGSADPNCAGLTNIGIRAAAQRADRERRTNRAARSGLM